MGSAAVWYVTPSLPQIHFLQIWDSMVIYHWCTLLTTNHLTIVWRKFLLSIDIEESFCPQVHFPLTTMLLDNLSVNLLCFKFFLTTRIPLQNDTSLVIFYKASAMFFSLAFVFRLSCHLLIRSQKMPPSLLVRFHWIQTTNRSLINWSKCWKITTGKDVMAVKTS